MKKKDIYELLDTPRNATKSGIKEAWKRLAFYLHPDRGGSVDDFIEAQEAYEEAYARAFRCAKCKDTGTLSIRGAHSQRTLRLVCDCRKKERK